MAPIYTVHFAVNYADAGVDEPSHARFEFEANAVGFADALADAGIDAHVTDMNRDTVHDPDVTPYPNGIYLIADTPPRALPLAVEDGSGDRNALREALAEHDVEGFDE